MNLYPDLSHFKRHAKHISRTFHVSLSSAKEIVAFMHDCNDWSELISKSSNHQEAFGSTKFSCLPSPIDLTELKKSLNPHMSNIRKIFNPSTHIPGSILDKVIKGNFHHISSHVVRHLLYEEPISESHTTEEVTLLLSFLDDTFSNVLTKKHRASVQLNICSNLYGHRLYGYCHFFREQVHILCREWDLELTRPSNKKGDLNTQSICSRPWFKGYMIEYMKSFISQCRNSGYTGYLNITRVQNAYISKWVNHEPDKYRNAALEELFEALSALPDSQIKAVNGLDNDKVISFKI